MKKYYLLIAAFCLLQNISAQKKVAAAADSTVKKIDLDEVVISSSNFMEKKKNIAQKIEIISSKTIAQINAQNTGDLLQNTGKVFVQKSQQGGSSPVLRGFEASRILLVIDGVRMNNAIYRSGHLQNVITTDQNSLARVEIMYGPSSTAYGSDALGGIIQLITKSPILSADKKFLTTGTAFARYSTVNNEKTLHADISLGAKKIAWLQSYNYSDFGDMKMGNNYSDKYPDFGRRTNYIGQINGVDTVLKNPDDRLQKFSGFKQWDILQKVLYKPNDRVVHLLNFQLSNSTNVPRYDRLQDTRNFGGSLGNTLRYAEWYYGPQKRLLAAYEFGMVNAGFFNEIKANINYQVIEESRQSREYRHYDRFDSQVEKVNIFGMTVSGRKIVGNNEIVIGSDVQLNKVNSEAQRTNLITGQVSKIVTRYPDGKNNMNSVGAYVQHTYKFKNKKLVLNDGIRVQLIHLKSNVLDNSFFNLPDTAVIQNNVAVNGNIGLIFSPQKYTTIRTAVSSGFRAPNIDDLSKIFESNTAAKQVVVPNSNLKPEYTYNIDVELTQKFLNNFTLELSGFFCLFKNAIIKAPFTLNGQDSINFNNVRSQVLASQNVNKARLYGFNAALNVVFLQNFVFKNSVAFTNGRYKTDQTILSSIYEKDINGNYIIVKRNVRTKPLDHIPPVIGKSSLNYRYKKYDAEVYVIYNGRKLLENYNVDGEDNAQYATKDGMPAWATANFKGSVTLKKYLQIQVGVENIFDKNYRSFASGFSGAGRNFIVALRTNW